MQRTLSISAALFLAAALSAQNYVTSPKGYLTTEGATNHNYMMFSKAEMRWQACDRSHVGGKAIVMNNVAWRRDAGASASSNYGVRTFTNFSMVLGSGDFHNLDKDNLDNNFSSTPTVVITPKNVNAADWSAASTSTPEKWTNSLKFDKPFVYLAKEAFVWEVRYTANTSTTDYPFDFQYVGSSTGNSTGGTVLGTSCTATGQTSAAGFDLTFHNHGDKFRIERSVSRMPANTPVLLAMDFTNPNLNVPGYCTNIYALPVFLWQGGPATTAAGTSDYTFDNIPHVPGISGAKLYFQAWCIDLQQAVLPITMSHGREIVIPADVKPYVVTRHYHYKNANSTSLIKSGPWYGGIITRFGS